MKEAPQSIGVRAVLEHEPDSLPWAGEVGNAAKMMLIVNMVQGSFMATIAEGLTLAQVTGQSQQTLLDILNQGQLASIFLDQKCQSKSPLTSLKRGELGQSAIPG